jgi:cytochrome c oxidase assembly protein subunit 15
MTQLHRYAVATAVCAFILLIAGGMVTSTGSALAVPDWPLAFGHYFPKMTGGVFFEHGHRMIAGIVGLMTFGLAIWVWRVEKRRWVQWLAAAAAAGIVLQALLGGITVLYGLPPIISIGHAVLGQTVFCLIVVIAQVTSRWFINEQRPLAADVPVPTLGMGLAIAAIYVQLILGAVIRHSSQTAFPHMVMALVTAGIVLWVSTRTWIQSSNIPLLARPASLLMLLVPLQLFLGLGALMLRMASHPASGLFQAALRTSHVVCGAAILGGCAVLGLRVWRSS